MSYNQNRFIESNDLGIVFNLIVIIQHCRIHPSDCQRSQPNFLSCWWGRAAQEKYIFLGINFHLLYLNVLMYNMLLLSCDLLNITPRTKPISLFFCGIWLGL